MATRRNIRKTSGYAREIKALSEQVRALAEDISALVDVAPSGTVLARTATGVGAIQRVQLSGLALCEDADGGVTVAVDHGALTGLADDDHSQYLLLLGRAGGQIAYGGTGAGDDLTLRSTSHATKGSVILDGLRDKLEATGTLWIDPTLRNVFVGDGDAGNATGASGADNIAIGNDALDALTTGTRNLAIGTDALGADTNAVGVIAIGYRAIAASAVNDDGVTALGYRAAESTAEVADSVVIGRDAARLQTTTINNCVIIGALANNTGAGSVTSSVIVGSNAAPGFRGSASVLIGRQAGYALTTADNNTHIGYQPGQSSTGHSNILIGRSVAPSLTTGTDNVIIGNRYQNVAVAANVPAGATLYVVVTADADAAGAPTCVVADPALRSVHVGSGGPGGWNGTAGASGTDNVAIGDDAADVITSGSGGVYIGSGVAGALTTGLYNTLLGYGNAPTLTTGSNNVVIGAYEGTSVAADVPAADSVGYIVIAAEHDTEVPGDSLVVVTPDFNVFIGALTPGNWLTSSGANNTIVGSAAGASLTTGHSNSMFGYGSGSNLTDGDSNILIGNYAYVANAPASGTNDHLNIGNLLFGDLSGDTIRIGGSGAVSLDETFAVVGGTDDTTAVSSVETTGANGAKCRFYVGDQDPSGTISAVGGSMYFRVNGASSKVYQNTTAGTGTTWSALFTTSLTLGYRAITALHTLDSSDYTVDCTANSFTVTLPTAVGIGGQVYNIKNTGNGLITVATTSSQTIDGAASGTITLAQYACLTVQSTGANWIIL